MNKQTPSVPKYFNYNIKIFMKLEEDDERRTVIQNRWDARKQRKILNGSIQLSNKSKNRKM